MKQRYFLIAYLIVLGLLNQPVKAQIQGRAFQDANANGYFDTPGEQGIARVRVRVYDRVGQLLATTRTDTLGEYSLPRLPAQPLQVQFDELPPDFILHRVNS